MTKEEKQQYHILILEDDLDTQQHIRKIVQNFGYQISGTATTYEEAVTSAETSFPHVALCDINLESDKDGIDVARTLKEMGNVAVYIPYHALRRQYCGRGFANQPGKLSAKKFYHYQSRPTGHRNSKNGTKPGKKQNFAQKPGVPGTK